MRSSEAANPGAPAPWLNARRFAWLLAGLFVLTYPGLLAGTRTLFFRDYGVISYPVIAWQHDGFWRGEWPSWDPYSHCGAPFIAQWGAMALYPFSLVYLLLPLPWSLNLFWAAHLFLGGVGMSRLAESWCKNPFAARVAGVAFVFNGLVFSSLAWPNYAVALGWMPWVVLLVEKGWRAGGRPLAAGALAGGLQMLSGVPEIVLLTWGFISLLWLRGMRQAKGERGALALRFALAVVLVAGLAAAQLLPFFDLLSRSQRDAGFGSSGWSMPGWGWASLFCPLFHAAQSPQGVFYQPHHVFITSYYLGLGWMTLAGFAAVCRSFPRKLILLAATAAGLVLALGSDGYLFSALKELFPQLGFARFPVKFFYLTAFCLPLLAAHGVAAVMDFSMQRGKDRWQFGWVLAVAGVITGLIVFFGWLFPFPSDHWPEMAVNSVERAGFMLATGLGVLWAAQTQGASAGRFAQLAVLALLWLDAVSYSPHLIPTVPAEAFAPGEPPMRPVPELGISRAMVSGHAEQHLYASRVPDFLNDYLGKRLALWSNLNLIQRIPKVDGALTLQIREEAEVESALRGTSTNAYPKLLDFLGVSQITAPEKIVDWEERPSARPWITAGQKPLIVQRGRTLPTLLEAEFDPGREVILENPAAESFKSLERQPNARVIAVHFASNRIEVQAESPSPTLLVIAQTFHPGWRAWVDGQPVPLLRANHAFQALPLTAGRHTVLLRYQDRLFVLGGAISLASLLAVFLLSRRPKGTACDEASVSQSGIVAPRPKTSDLSIL